MTIEDHVVSVELAKELFNLGYFAFHNCFYWHSKDCGETWSLIDERTFKILHIEDRPPEELTLFAPLASEIEVVLCDGWDAHPCNAGYEVGWANGIMQTSHDPDRHFVLDKKLADAFAKMWIYLKQE